MDWTTEVIVSNWRDIETHDLNRFVFRNRKRQSELAETMTLLDKTDTLLHRRRGIDPEREEVFPSHALCLNVFNFYPSDPSQPGGKYFVENPEDQTKPFAGSFALAARIYQTFGERVITAGDLLPYFDTLQHVIEFFRGRTDIPLPVLRLLAGQDYIHWLNRRFDGNPNNILSEATHGGVLYAFHGGSGLVDLLVENFVVAYGQDTHRLYGRRFPFYKRPKLNAFMLDARARGSNGKLPLVADIKNVGPIAEPQIVRWLRHHGVLEFTPELDRCIENGEALGNRSAEVIEMRAAATTACVEWCEAWGCSARDLDAHMFYSSRGLSTKAYRSPSSDC